MKKILYLFLVLVNIFLFSICGVNATSLTKTVNGYELTEIQDKGELIHSEFAIGYDYNVITSFGATFEGEVDEATYNVTEIKSEYFLFKFEQTQTEGQYHLYCITLGKYLVVDGKAIKLTNDPSGYWEILGASDVSYGK